MSRFITPYELRRMPLTVTRFRQGYDADEVDDLLDEAAESLEALKLYALIANSRYHAVQPRHRHEKRKRRVRLRKRRMSNYKGRPNGHQ